MAACVRLNVDWQMFMMSIALWTWYPRQYAWQSHGCKFGSQRKEISPTGDDIVKPWWARMYEVFVRIDPGICYLYHNHPSNPFFASITTIFSCAQRNVNTSWYFLHERGDRHCTSTDHMHRLISKYGYQAEVGHNFKAFTTVTAWKM
jgi:hypothetical protein